MTTNRINRTNHRTNRANQPDRWLAGCVFRENTFRIDTTDKKKYIRE